MDTTLPIQGNDLIILQSIEDELRPITPLWESVYHLINGWLHTKNPHYIDVVIMFCADNFIPFTPVLLGQIRKAALLRFSGEPSGTPDAVKRETIDAQAMYIMLYMIYLGHSLDTASSKAATFYSRTTHNKTKKASSLQKDYTARYRGRNNLENKIFSDWKTRNTDIQEMYGNLIDSLPECSEDLKGERR